jgi:hypothetical protein
MLFKRSIWHRNSGDSNFALVGSVQGARVGESDLIIHARLRQPPRGLFASVNCSTRLCFRFSSREI